MTALVEDVLVAAGADRGHAAVAAERIVEADVRGIPSHGVVRVPAYIRRIEAGGYNLRPAIRVERETPATALLDGDNGLGHVIVTRAMGIAVEKARSTGVGWVSVRRSNHAGAGGIYASMALQHDMIGVYMAVGNAPHMAPWGGLDALMSTNPLAVAIPAGQEPPIVFDMATTVASYGRVKLAARRGESIPEGWMIDRSGAPVTDPRRSAGALLQPMGGYKGFGLNLVIASLAGVLGGAASGSDIVDFNKDDKSPTNTGQAVLVIRPDTIRPLDEFRREMDERIRELTRSVPAPGGEGVRIPGSRLPKRRADAVAHGVEIAADVVDELVSLAARLGADRTPLNAQTATAGIDMDGRER
ncbi:Ldh family oxidoreductase [Microbacterium ulmi]|uniref:Ldh family oxidoreductase n=1 Tax=Microbacterium ulmi TaxID=179095 RepID=UPI00141EC86A|nr:LDH2 family malate/lactate/ureidoglycolate dehydrogenase [Microbacterium ulmi]